MLLPSQLSKFQVVWQIRTAWKWEENKAITLKGQIKELYRER